MITSKIKHILEQVLDISTEDFQKNIDIYSCEEWDSMSHMRLILELERIFLVNFSDEEVMDMTSYKNICDVVKKHKND
jgi:acyl carrier protein